MNKSIKAVILAAGKGTRLRTEGEDLPKVMRAACGRPLLHYVLDGLSFLNDEDIILVVGYKKEHVLARFGQYPHAVQEEQLGTGHAVMAAAPLLEGFPGAVLVCCGDMPLITRDTYRALIETHFATESACTILSSDTKEPLPFGRIIRDEEGAFRKIVEDKDCTPEEKAVTELNAGVYVFQAELLLPALGKLRNTNAQGEYYLTDVPELLLKQGEKVGVCCRPLGEEIIGVNTLEQLHEVEQILRAREG
jgi:UDP-N-acetylglucosamine diphosphorylase/glucosamine-1-phosphate N-acetyltransferase